MVIDAATTIDDAPVEIGATSASRHAWADVTALQAAVAGDSGRLIYLLATGRTASAVVHWRQGPFLIGDETTTVQVELPSTLLASVLKDGRGWLSVTVASTTLDDREFPREPLGRTPLVIEADRVVGVPRERWEAVFPDQLDAEEVGQ